MRPPRARTLAITAACTIALLSLTSPASLAPTLTTTHYSPSTIAFAHAATPSSTSPSSPLPIPPARPPLANRTFTSTSINSLITDLSSRILDPNLATLFSNTYPNTLDTTISHFSYNTTTHQPTSFIITGDITAQWLRDSMNQLLHYVPYASTDPLLRDLICGLIRRQASDILHDPYANAFNYNASSAGNQQDVRTPTMTPLVYEGKWELDSLCALLKLSYAYYTHMLPTDTQRCLFGSSDPNDDDDDDEIWLSAVALIVSTMQQQQDSTPVPSSSPYLFQRTTSVATDTLMLQGTGNTARRTGMIRSAFRASDDSTLFPFHIPANAMAVVELQHLAIMLTTFASNHPSSPQQQQQQQKKLQHHHMSSLAATATLLSSQINAGIQLYGIITPPPYILAQLPPALVTASSNRMYAYEVDGYGGQTLMDDANIPSLLSLPLLGYCNTDNTTNNDPIYALTRAFVLSELNPYFFSGKAGAGIGGPHVGLGYVWPMSLIVRAWTSVDDEEIMECLTRIVVSSVGTGFIHESFNRDNAMVFTREWFAWVNALFGGLVLKIAKDRPYLLFGSGDEEAKEEKRSVVVS